MTSRSLLNSIPALGLALCIASAQAQFTFDPATNLPTGPRPDGVATADLDGDGDLDVAITVDDPDRVVIFINNGAGVFAAGPSISLPSSSSPGDLAAGDLDGDGDADLAVVLRDLNQVRPILRTGATFALGTAAAIGNNGRGLASADIDGDGDLDLAIANRDDNTATVLRNNGSAIFASTTVAVGLEPRAATFGNFNGDSLLDLAVTNHDSRSISVLTNGGASFTLMTTLSTGGNLRPEGIVAADLDNDGDDDLAAATSSDNNGNFASVYVRTAAGFNPMVNYSTGGIESSVIEAGDFDCDGARDLAVTNEDSGNISLLRNVGGAAFGPPSVRATGAHPDGLAIADIDGDGDADLAVTNRDSNTLSILRNATCAPQRVGDFNGDALVNVADLLILLGAWGACPASCPCDLNADVVVNVGDLLIVIANWG